MNVGMPRMRIGFLAASLLLAASWSLPGCGGSGSSGFDVAPVTAEPQAITRAFDRGECVDLEQQTFCASGVEARTAEFTSALVIIEEPSSPLVCNGPDGTQTCTASLEFATAGFTTPTSLLAAVSETEKGPWTLVPLTVDDDVTAPRTVSITVPGDSGAATPKPVIVAVLVYAGAAPASVPPISAHLADFGSDVIYVSSRLTIAVPR